MALPTTNTNTITISTAAAVVAPSAGYVTYFFDSNDGNRLYYKDSAGVVTLATQGDIADCCSCKILTNFSSSWNRALLTGVITPAEYATILTAGVTVVTPSGTWTVSS